MKILSQRTIDYVDTKAFSGGVGVSAADAVALAIDCLAVRRKGMAHSPLAVLSSCTSLVLLTDSSVV